MPLPTESDARTIASDLFGEPVTTCTRFTTGLRHWVYDVVLQSGRNVVMRLSHGDHRDELRGGVYWNERLRERGVVVPELLGLDLDAPQPYMALERLPGTDLGNVFDELSELQRREVATAVNDMQQRTGELPRGNGFGYALDYESPLEGSWYDVVLASVDRSDAQIQDVGAVDAKWAAQVRSRVIGSRARLAEVEPVAFLHDATTKNVIVTNGAVSGLVDVDHMAFGDPLWAVALTRMSLLSARRPVDYIDWLAADPDQERLDLYTAVFCLGFLAEVGQKFNKSHAPPLDTAHQIHLEQNLREFL